MRIALSHIAIAAPTVAAVLERFRALGLVVDEEHDVPTERVRASMVPVDVSDAFRIELLEPSASDSPIAKFLEKRPAGGLHHICFEIDRIEEWRDRLVAAGLEILPPGIRKGARGRALFVHPKSLGGVLVELEELAR